MVIGICDYGIGGVSLYKRLREHTDADIIYFSDTGFVPYGKVPEHTLRAQVQRVINYLRDKGANRIVVACNAASTVLPDDPDVVGMIDFGIRTVLDSGSAHTGVIGGFRTVESEVYKRPLEQLGVKVIQRPAQALSICIEAGETDSALLRSELKTILEPLQSCETLLLACTHYPAIAPLIQEYVPDVKLLDPMHLLTQSLLRDLGSGSGNRHTRWITSGDPEKMKTAAENAFGVQLTDIEYLVI